MTASEAIGRLGMAAEAMSTAMPTRTYLAVAEKSPGEAGWSLLFPDFPEIASSAPNESELYAQALDAIRTAAEARAEDGEGLPEPSGADTISLEPVPIEAQLAGHRRALLVVPLELPGVAVRVNVSLDQHLLHRIDAAAGRLHMTRSGFLAEGARRLLQSEPD